VEDQEAVVAVLAAALEVGLAVDHAEVVLINHKDRNHLILTIQKTTIMALKNETKSSVTRKGKSLANRKVTLLIGKKAEVASEEGVRIGAVVAQIGEVVVVVAADIRIVQSKHLHLTLRTVTSK
jgi:hypothetical protein